MGKKQCELIMHIILELVLQIWLKVIKRLIIKKPIALFPLLGLLSILSFIIGISKSNNTSCTQVHDLPQSHCGDNQERIVFMITYILHPFCFCEIWAFCASCVLWGMLLYLWTPNTRSTFEIKSK